MYVLILGPASLILSAINALWRYQSSPPGGELVGLAAGGRHTCGLRPGGEAVCWGLDDDGQVSDTPTGSGYTDIGAGDYHTCALNSSGGIECWGDDRYGQVSDAP